MNIYFRCQHKGISFDEMRRHVSDDGGDGLGEVGGVCACAGATDMLNNTVLPHPENDYGMEIVIFRGISLATIYDGERVEPVEELARFSIREFVQRAYEIEEEYANGNA